jgi:hypothetical protein
MDIYLSEAMDYLKHPDSEALSFYCNNHIYSICCMRTIHPNAPLRELEPFVKDYVSLTTSQAARAFYYLLLICARESRHNHASTSYYSSIATSEVAKILSTLASYNSAHDVVSLLRKCGILFKGVKLKDFTHGMMRGFYEGDFSGGYGGTPWGDVAKCLHNFVTGVYTGEMMMDTVWTLCHNNGPIFNKGMLYHGYTNELKVILDVQRAGLIPSMIMDVCSYAMPYISTGTISEEGNFARVGDFFSLIGKKVPHVNWDVVSQLGALSNHTGFKGLQMAKFGDLSNEDYDEFAKHTLEKVKKAKKAEAEKFYQITPTLKVPVFKRKES